MLLDVVYNHTGEGNELGPTVSFRGIDNAAYYRLDRRNASKYRNESGTGNTLDATHPAVVQLVLDSLHTFAERVRRRWLPLRPGDGAGSNRPRLLGQGAALRGDHGRIRGWRGSSSSPSRGTWACSATASASSPPAGANGTASTATRSAASGRGSSMRPETSRSASAARPTCTRSRERGPAASVNFVTSHDGFTLRDLVSYAEKHNQANGEGNHDGENADDSRQLRGRGRHR